MKTLYRSTFVLLLCFSLVSVSTFPSFSVFANEGASDMGTDTGTDTDTDNDNSNGIDTSGALDAANMDQGAYDAAQAALEASDLGVGARDADKGDDLGSALGSLAESLDDLSAAGDMGNPGSGMTDADVLAAILEAEVQAQATLEVATYVAQDDSDKAAAAAASAAAAAAVTAATAAAALGEGEVSRVSAEIAIMAAATVRGIVASTTSDGMSSAERVERRGSIQRAVQAALDAARIAIESIRNQDGVDDADGARRVTLEAAELSSALADFAQLMQRFVASSASSARVDGEIAAYVTHVADIANEIGEISRRAVEVANEARNQSVARDGTRPVTSRQIALIRDDISAASTRARAIAREINTIEDLAEDLARAHPRTFGQNTSTSASSQSGALVRPRADVRCTGIIRTLQLGDRDATTDNQVSNLQRFFVDHYQLDPNEYLSGYFGPRTRELVMRFQRESGIAQAGIVGPQTRGNIAVRCSAMLAPTQTQNPTQTSNPTTTTAPTTPSNTQSNLTLAPELSGSLSVTPGACASPTTRSVTVSWSTRNAQYTVAQAAGGQYGSGQNLFNPGTTHSDSMTLTLPTGNYLFSVAGYNNQTAGWEYLKTSPLTLDAGACTQSPTPTRSITINSSSFTPSTLTPTIRGTAEGVEAVRVKVSHRATGLGYGNGRATVFDSGRVPVMVAMCTDRGNCPATWSTTVTPALEAGQTYTVTLYDAAQYPTVYTSRDFSTPVTQTTPTPSTAPTTPATTPATTPSSPTASPELSGSLSVTPGACASPTTRSVTVSWSTRNAQYTVAQAAGGQYGSGQNLFNPGTTHSDSMTLTLPTGNYLFSVAGYNNQTAGWEYLKTSPLTLDAGACTTSYAPSAEGNLSQMASVLQAIQNLLKNLR